MRSIKSLDGQNLTDIAMQEYGEIDALFNLTEDNPTLQWDQPLPAGTVVMIRETPVVNDQALLDYLRIRNYPKVATDDDLEKCEGIGCMIIEDDFEVT